MRSGLLRAAQPARSCRGTECAAVVPIEGPLLLRTLRQEFENAALPWISPAVRFDCAGLIQRPMRTMWHRSQAMTLPEAMTPKARKSAPKADEVPSIGIFPLLRLGLLVQGAEGFAHWVSRNGTGSARIHVAGRGLLASRRGTPGRAHPPACLRPRNLADRSSNVPAAIDAAVGSTRLPEAIHPWRCVRCAGLEYRVRAPQAHRAGREGRRSTFT